MDKNNFKNKMNPTVIFIPFILILVYLIACLACTTLGFILMVSLLILYLVAPLAIYFSSCLLRQIVFMNIFKKPQGVNYGIPSSMIACTSNDYVEYKDEEQDISLGLWHVLPDTYTTPNGDCLEKPEVIPAAETIVLYLHGNSGTRATSHRLGIYKVLKAMNFHVITFDYRGYSDSSSITPSEKGLVKDSMAVYEWIIKKSEGSKVIVWGHSLGSGVACQLLEDLSKQEELQMPFALVLEAPFNTLTDEILHHMISAAYTIYPFYNGLITESLKRANVLFASENHIKNVNVPILILHAEDDEVIPFKLGAKLFMAAKKDKNDEEQIIKFHSFPSGNGLGHKYIYTSQDLPEVVNNFISEIDEKKSAPEDDEEEAQEKIYEELEKND